MAFRAVERVAMIPALARTPRAWLPCERLQAGVAGAGDVEQVEFL
jgi:hypothetical protein